MKFRNALVACCLCFQTAISADLEENLRAFWVPDKLSGSASGGEALTGLEEEAAALLAKQLDSGFFEGVITGSTDGTGGALRRHTEMLLLLARAHETPGQAYFESEEALRGYQKALAALESELEAGMERPGNWWHWEIGIPKAYGPALILMRDHINPDLQQEALATLDYLIKDRPRPSIVMTGQNLIWVSFTRLYLGILTGQMSLIETAAEQIASVVRITTKEGVQPDYSFHQHGSSLQTGHYGAAYAKDIGVYAYLMDGTPWDLSKDALNTWLSYLREGCRWSIYQNYYEPSSRGRAIVRRENTGDSNALQALLLGARLESPEGNQLQHAALQILETWQEPMDPSYAMLAERIKKEGGEPAGPVGFRFYPHSDYAIHRGTDWFISLKLLSDRMLAAERVNDEGKQSRHLSSGVTWMMRTGNEWDREGIRPALDWERLPGATVERGLDLSKGYPNYACFGLRSFVGGLEADAKSGIAAMDYKALVADGDSDLVAMKSWFFWPGGFVAIGSGITGRSGRPVETIAMQWPLFEGDRPITVDGVTKEESSWTEELEGGEWLATSDWRLWLQEGKQARAVRQMQEGAFVDISRSGDTVYQHPFLNVFIPHGVNPVDAGYAYAVFPAPMDSQSGELPFEIWQQANGIHAVSFPGQNLLLAVFWEPGRVGPLAAKHPMLASLKSLGENTYALSVADPTQSFDGPLEVQLAGTVTSHEPEAGAEVEVLTTANGRSISSIRIDVDSGASRQLTLTIKDLIGYSRQGAWSTTLKKTGPLENSGVKSKRPSPDRNGSAN